ncbi:LysM peptidoglycan-binding domain-containing protein [Leucobacter sp. CSA2]|uniref:LysM peptidoglycan-binding domain-containing protein n=1 Tax=Leucobacter edaphi TaxID=2796472 RepID=A0A934QCT3_9MICO|nr:LysM peptidoglycan-binding domain-containing protein [Leucobacter edaphi]MBK0420897.1 LysM peptidoglycan-binding domain-containing protein [Leucobacter edaphi]
MSAQAIQVEDLTAAPKPVGRIKLTRRGRALFGGLATVLVAAVLALLASFAAPSALASNAANSGQDFHYVVAQPGESLWSLASELDPAADPRDLVAEIVQLNQLEDSGVEAGQPVAVPLRYNSNPSTVSGEELGLDA